MPFMEDITTLRDISKEQKQRAQQEFLQEYRK
jgi:hypothetical protein